MAWPGDRRSVERTVGAGSSMGAGSPRLLGRLSRTLHAGWRRRPPASRLDVGIESPPSGPVGLAARLRLPRPRRLGGGPLAARARAAAELGAALPRARRGAGQPLRSEADRPVGRERLVVGAARFRVSARVDADPDQEAAGRIRLGSGARRRAPRGWGPSSWWSPPARAAAGRCGSPTSSWWRCRRERPYAGTPHAVRQRRGAGHPPSSALDGDPATAWRAPATAAAQTTWTLDFGEPREFGGLTLRWERAARPRVSPSRRRTTDGGSERCATVERAGGGAQRLLPARDRSALAAPARSAAAASSRRSGSPRSRCGRSSSANRAIALFETLARESAARALSARILWASRSTGPWSARTARRRRSCSPRMARSSSASGRPRSSRS